MSKQNIFISKTFSRLVPTKILSASKQVVTGMIYRVNIKMEESTCKNTEWNKNKNVVDCPSRNTVSQTCKFTIWSRPWMKKFGKDLIITGKICQ